MEEKLHHWDFMVNVKCLQEYEAEDGETMQGQFSSYAASVPAADATSMIHWMSVLAAKGVSLD